MDLELLYVLAYFIIYSFFGWVMESVLKTVIQKKFVNSGFLYGPICPIYGFGAVIMFVFLERFKENILFLFIISCIILSIWEYLVGWMLELIFKTKYWDYSDHKYNIKGRVCLENSLFWGILGVLFIHFIHPFIVEKIAIIPREILLYIVTILTITLIVDLIISITKLLRLQVNINKINEITEKIKDRVEELKENRQINTESIQQIIDDLKYKQSKINRRLLRQTIRMKRAFPTMKSDAIEKINEFLNQKIEVRKKDKSK